MLRVVAASQRHSVPQSLSLPPHLTTATGRKPTNTHHQPHSLRIQSPPPLHTHTPHSHSTLTLHTHTPHTSPHSHSTHLSPHPSPNSPSPSSCNSPFLHRDNEGKKEPPPTAIVDGCCWAAGTWTRVRSNPSCCECGRRHNPIDSFGTCTRRARRGRIVVTL